MKNRKYTTIVFDLGNVLINRVKITAEEEQKLWNTEQAPASEEEATEETG